jgi:GNAT superfamily N-acetyltransferase
VTTVLPADSVAWADLASVVGAARCHGVACWCQRFKLDGVEWRELPDEARQERFRQESAGAEPGGLVAFVGGEPAAWCNVEPRPSFTALARSRVPWKGREEDRSDGDVWAVTCFLTRPRHRRTGLTHVLAAAAVDFARERGARALEGYAMLVDPGRDVPWGELHVGSVGAFAAAGFAEVSRPTPRRVVMRIEL